MGKLYLVSTPIGNLEDITLRALNILKEVSLILAEDTRHSAKLLNHYNIKGELLSYRDENHDRVISAIVANLEGGADIALISDAGTPAISDPGFKLVRELSKRNVQIVSIPGPVAAVAALSVSGLPTDRFLFLGFLPKQHGKREKLLRYYMEGEHTLLIYESPYRVMKLIDQISQLDPERFVSVVKDITKMHEKIFRGTASQLQNDLKKHTLKGEFVVAVAKAGYTLQD